MDRDGGLMDTADLLNRFETEGITVSLNLKLSASAKPSDETLSLIEENSADLITVLALRHISGAGYHLNISTSTGKAYVMAKPHHIKEAVELYPWGVVFDSEKRLITKWGDVPKGKLLGLCNLVTGETVIDEHLPFDELGTSSNKSPSGTQKSDLMNAYNSLPGITEAEGVV